MATESERAAPALRVLLTGATGHVGGAPAAGPRGARTSDPLPGSQLRALRRASMRAQPIGIDDLLACLPVALHAEPARSAIYEIGGAGRMSYADLMRT